MVTRGGVTVKAFGVTCRAAPALSSAPGGCG
jgi:hypothetical protein